MARSKSLFKNSYNQLLDKLSRRAPGDLLGPTARLAEELGVSLSTANALVERLGADGIISGSGRNRRVMRPPRDSDYFSPEETRSATTRLEEGFLRSIIGGSAQPGDPINELQLAREFNTSTSLVREYLIHFSRFGIIEKRPNRHWILRGITHEFIDEVLTLRETFALISAAAMQKLPKDHPVWEQLRSIKERLSRFIAKKVVGNREFQDLEHELYTLLANASGNRFIKDFTEVSLSIVYYNYHIDRGWEITENKLGADMLISFIGGIESGDPIEIQFWTKRWIERARVAYKMVVSGIVGDGAPPRKRRRTAKA